MSRKSKTRSSKNKTRTRKQKQLYMVGCSKKGNENTICPRCGPNCHCGPNCNCPHNCKGNCYLNRRKGTRHNRKIMNGGTGCGSCGCPLAPLSWNQMNKYGGSYAKSFDQPVIHNNGEFGPILGIGQNGGMCSACGQIPVQMGGNLTPIPPPFIGPAWSPEQNNPGNYLSSYSNVLSNDPQLQMTMNDSGYKTMNSMIGGYTYDTKTKSKSKSKTSKSSLDSKINSKSMFSKSSSSKSGSYKSRSSKPFSMKKGGGLIPQDLVNLGRNFEYNMNSAYNSLNGYKAPVNPLPYKDQLTNTANKIVFV